MDGNFKNKEVICCFCGEALLLINAAVITIKPRVDSEEIQELYCHKNHLVEKIDKSIPLHPDFFDDDTE